jgi:hypothetical protein
LSNASATVNSGNGHLRRPVGAGGKPRRAVTAVGCGVDIRPASIRSAPIRSNGFCGQGVDTDPPRLMSI